MGPALRMRIRSLPGTLVLAAGIIAASVLSPAAALADGPLSVHVQMGDRCVAGHKPSDKPVKVKLLRHDGSAIETKHDPTTNLEWSVCFQHTPVPGNRIRLLNGTGDRTVSVPDLTATVDRVHGVVSGHGPSGRSVHIDWAECVPGGCGLPMPYLAQVKVNGRYHLDLSSLGIDVDGSDRVTVTYTNSHSDEFSRSTIAPYLEISKPNRIHISCLPRGATTVRLRSSTGVLRASTSFTTTTECGGASGSFRKNGHPVNVHTGDRITSDLASDTTVVWPTMSVDGQVTTLLGRCLDDAWLVVVVRHGTSVERYPGITDADGHFSIDASPREFAAGDTLDLACENGQGDRVRMVRTLKPI